MAFTIQATKRTKQTADDLRADRQIPAVVYGPQTPSTSVAVNYREFEKLYAAAGESSLIDFSIDGAAPVKALVQEVQYEPVKGRVLHVDFRQIDMTKEMNATVELHFIGESSAVKDLGGTLIKTLEEVDVLCLPQNLVSHIDIDLSVLKGFTDVIHVSDLVLPNGITVENDADMVLAKVAAPLTEDEIKAMEAVSAPVDLSKIEVEKKGKTLEEGAEGAAEGGEKKEEKK